MMQYPPIPPERDDRSQTEPGQARQGRQPGSSHHVPSGQQQAHWEPEGNPDAFPLADEYQKKQNRRPVVLLIVLSIVLVLLFARFRVFIIKNLYITGSVHVSKEQIAKDLGLDQGLFYLDATEERISKAINANQYLVFESMHRVVPNSLYITVKSRVPFAFFTHLGIGYVLAQDGIILEKSRDLSLGRDLIMINGLSIWQQAEVGSYPSSADPSQLEDLILLLETIQTWGFERQISSLDLSQNLSISLLTYDDFTINLGDIEQIYAKIGTVQAAISTLRNMKMSGGIIEAGMPGEVTYRAHTP